jgi:predicted nucleotidyltransferase
MSRDPEEIAVLRTLAFFGLFDRGLTLQELQDFALFRFIDNVVAVTRSLGQHGDLIADGDVVGLASAPHASLLASIRNEREVQAEPLIARAQRYARVARHLPYVREVRLVNSLALGTNHARSDIDLLIVGRAGRLWLTRALTTSLAHVLGWRRHDAFVADRLCLSFFLADDALDLESISLGDDVYLAYWVATARRLSGSLPPGALLAANAWAREMLPNAPFPEGPGERPSRVQAAFEWVLDRTGLGWLFDRSTKLILGRRTRRKAAKIEHQHVAGTVVTDRMQKFHDRDRRMEFRLRWKRACERLGV